MPVLSAFFSYGSDQDGLESTIELMLKILKKLSEDAPSEDARQSWALVIAKDDELVKNGLSKRFYQKPDDRIWFDSIQICRVDSLDQLKAELCSLHVSVQEQKNDILDIIEYEKHGQPPSIVLVNGLFAYLKMDPALDNELQYSATSLNELSNLLACLLESCIYLSTKNGVSMNHLIELILTDFLPSNMDEVTNVFQKSYTTKLHKILSYYLNHVYS